MKRSCHSECTYNILLKALKRPARCGGTLVGTTSDAAEPWGVRNEKDIWILDLGEGSN